MFRKIVSNLAFSPALVGQLGFYAKRLRKEESTRRIGLIFVALALVVQSFAVFSPPEPANASNADNIVYNGIRNKADMLAVYDRGSDSAGRSDIKQIYTHFGVTRADIANTHMGTYNTNDFNGKINTLGRSNWGVANRSAVKINNSSSTIYTGGFLDSYNQKSWPMPALIGKRAVDGSWFAITLSCGNLVYTSVPTPPKPTPPKPVAPKPVATCSSLKITALSRDKVKLDATAAVSGGATISSYTYVIKDSKGAIILDRTVPTTGTSSSIQQTLSKDGGYTATVTVATSIGNKTDANCAKKIVISPEPLCPLNPEIAESNPECKPCADDKSLWYKDDKCVATFELSKTVRNVTQSISDATGTTAKPGDTLQYTLTIKNSGKSAGDYTMTDNVADITEYADVVDLGDGTIVTKDTQNNLATAVATWPTFTNVKPGNVVQRTILVKIKHAIPSMASNITNQSYDCRLTNTFGNTLNVGVDCPPEKVVEQVVAELPRTGAGLNMLFSGIVLSIVVYFYARSRQTSKEIRLIRRDLNAGTI